MPNQFPAGDSALGYLYQARLALFWSLKRLKDDPDFVVSLETLETSLAQNDITILRRSHAKTTSLTLLICVWLLAGCAFAGFGVRGHVRAFFDATCRVGQSGNVLPQSTVEKQAELI
jgi:hypothetical protein